MADLPEIEIIMMGDIIEVIKYRPEFSIVSGKVVDYNEYYVFFKVPGRYPAIDKVLRSELRYSGGRTWTSTKRLYEK